jgi:hypothetical protein
MIKDEVLIHFNTPKFPPILGVSNEEVCYSLDFVRGVCGDTSAIVDSS